MDWVEPQLSGLNIIFIKAKVYVLIKEKRLTKYHELVGCESRSLPFRYLEIAI
jgi:hypothetical protein